MVRWLRATRCDGGSQGECVEVAFPGEVWIRDSKNPDAGHLSVTRDVWREFTGSLKDGE